MAKVNRKKSVRRKGKMHDKRKSKKKSKNNNIDERSLIKKNRRVARRVIENRKKELEEASNDYIMSFALEPNGSTFPLTFQQADQNLQNLFDVLNADFGELFN
jgi:repressor of nif and glnA expression